MHRRLLVLLLLLSGLLAIPVAAQSDEPQTFEGELTEAEPEATFEIPLEAGQVITLTTASADGLDTVLSLNGPDGEVVAANDDEAEGITTSRIVYAAEAAGTYEAIVTGYENATGTFTLTVRFGADFGYSEAAEIILEQRVTLTRRAAEAERSLELAAGDIVVISTQALTPDLDTTLALLDSDGEIVAQNDDRGDGSLNSQIIYEVLVAGGYTVRVSTYDGEGEGSLLLSVATDPDAEPPFNFAALTGDLINEYSGTLDDAGPSVEYPVELTAGQTLLAVSDATAGDLDTVLSLRDPAGFLVASNDDRGDGSLNSAVAYTALESGTYTLILERFPRSTSSGEFQLTLSSVDSAVVGEVTALLESTVTLSGPEEIIETANFRVHYTLVGRDSATPEYAQAVAETLEEIYHVQVNQMGWAEPVRDSDGFYRAYIADTLGDTGALGYAKTVIVTIDNPGTPDVREERAARGVFVIDNDFEGLDKAASALSLMRATATHEFNHVIQFSYDYQEGLRWMVESTATWIETVTVGDDQDATDYVASDFEQPELCFTTTEQTAYSQWTLLQSLADEYGESIVRRLWENSVAHDGLETMTHTLEDAGTSLPAVIERWRAQNYARAYDLAPLFARAVWLEDTITEPGEWTITGAGIQELGANYYTLDLDGTYGFALDGADSLQLLGLGVRGDVVEVIRLGRKGVFETSPYEYAALMVFNAAVPAEPGACSFIDYAVRVYTVTGQTPAPAYTFSAANFKPLTEG